MLYDLDSKVDRVQTWRDEGWKWGPILKQQLSITTIKNVVNRISELPTYRVKHFEV